MARQQEVTIRIPAAGTVAGAIERIRALSASDELRIDLGDDGRVKVRGGGTTYLITSAYLTGQVVDERRGPVLKGAVHKSSNGLIWPWLMGIPAVFLLVCSSASVLFDGVSPGPLVIGIPGAVLLGFLTRYMLKQNEEHFRRDVTTMTEALREMLADTP